MSTPSTSNNGVIIAVAVVVVIGIGIGAFFLLKGNGGAKKPPPPGTPPKPTPPQATAATPGFPLTIGSSGQAVIALQQGLNGYVDVVPEIVVDGNFGASTANACAQAGFKLPINYNDFNTIIAPPDATNTSTGNILSDITNFGQAPAGTTQGVDANGNPISIAPTA